MKKCTIIGKFAFKENIMDGQTVKCKTIYNELAKKYGNQNVDYIDTYNWKKNIIKTFISCIKSLKYSENVIMLPAQNGVNVFGPLLFFLNKIYKKKLHYIVIGSWLFKKVNNNRLLRKSLSNFYAIYVETTLLKNKLEQIGFNNIFKMNNYKNLNILKEKEFHVFNYKKTLKICIFSRINYEKGIEDAINVIKKINNDKIKIKLFLYGLVEKNFESKFNELINENNEFVFYNGIVDFSKSVDIIKKYDLLLFPTRYKTEGIPGTIIDSFASGVPVLASSWENHGDIIDNNKDGLIFEFGNLDDLEKKIEFVYDNQNLIYSMKKNCLIKAKRFCKIQALDILFKKMEDL